jgi:formamidopyrimidine-DNA glycosylase
MNSTPIKVPTMAEMVANGEVPEILFWVGCSGSFDDRAKKITKAIIRILKRAVKVGGSSIATYRLLDKTKGNYAREHKVYGKAGKMCVKCKNPLEKTIIQSRTTVFCPRCQK